MAGALAVSLFLLGLTCSSVALQDGLPRIARQISYYPTNNHIRSLKSKAQPQQVAGTYNPDMSAATGSWWVPGASSEQPDAATTSATQEASTPSGSASLEVPDASSMAHKVHKKAAAAQKATAEATVAGTWTMPDSGAASATDMAGNLVLASKISTEAVRVKSYEGKKPQMQESTEIDPSQYPGADLADLSASTADAYDAAATAEAESPPVPEGAGTTAGQIATNPKITPQLPPPAPVPTGAPVTAFSNCSGYITKEEIMAGLEYAAGKVYMPFDQCWDQRLAAIQDYYGNPGAVMPFHFLNPGGYIGNVTFWLQALKDYQLGKAPYLVITTETPGSGNSSTTGVGVPINADGTSTVTPPASGTGQAPTVTGNGINWYGGPVLNSKAGLVIYYIWYGNWGNLANNGTAALPTTVKVLTDMAQSIGGKPWFNIVTTYYDNAGKVPNKVTYGGKAAVSTSSSCYTGTSLTNDAIFNVVDCVLRKKQVPYATNAVYFVLGASNIQATSGMCSSYCGWHTYGYDSSNRQTLFGFIGSPLPCLNACAAQGASNVRASPNNNAEADAMASIISHESAETVTDPLINAWYNTAGYENADLCAWTFSGATFAAGGGLANVRWNCPTGAAYKTCTSRYYLIQQDWVNVKPGYCSLSY